MLPALLVAALTVASQDPSAPAVSLRLNHDRYTVGDRARVYVEAQQDGYLVVLHADPDGRIRVLFPLDPGDDNFVRGAKRLEIRARSNRDAFQIDTDDGAGTVLAAVAADPFKFDSFTRNDHWDFRALGGPSATVKDDPLAGLVDIAQRMAGDTRFEYDVATYVVESRQIAGYGYHGRGWGYPYHFRFGFSYGYPFYDPFCFDPFWAGSCFGYGFGVGYYGYRYRSFYRPTFFGRTFGVRVIHQPRFVIPTTRERYTPVQVRPRGSSRSSGSFVRERSGAFSGGGRVMAPRSRPQSSPGVTRGGAERRPGRSPARPSNGGARRRG